MALRGDPESAAFLFREAAAVEAKALDRVPENKPRTRGILAVSAISLHFKGDDLVEAERLAHQLMGRGAVPEFASTQLRELLEAIWEKQTLRAANLELSEDAISVSLKGGLIGYGSAPTELVVEKLTAMHRLFYRTAEWLGDLPLRRRGPPSPSIREMCQPWIGQPQVGSFKFGIRLGRSLQPQFPELDGVQIQPGRIADTVMDLIRGVSPSGPQPPSYANLQNLVPQKDYRHALLRLIRNIAPDGTRSKTIEFVTRRERTVRSATLTPHARQFVQDSLREGVPSDDDEVQVNGSLRALNLETDWLHIITPQGVRVTCKMAHEALDDVIGLMVNRPVLAHGKYDRRRCLHIRDIELDPTGEEEERVHE